MFVFDSEIWEPIDLLMIPFTHNTLHTMPLVLAMYLSVIPALCVLVVQVTVHGDQKCLSTWPPQVVSELRNGLGRPLRHF